MTKLTLENMKHSVSGKAPASEVRAPRPAGRAPDRVNVMLLGGDQPALRGLHGTLRNRAKITLAEDLPQALEKLSREEIHAVFCAACFHCGSWVEALETIGFLYPALPIIVVGDAAPDKFAAPQRAEVYGAGAFDLLLYPQSETSVLFLLEHALVSGEARELRASA